MALVGVLATPYNPTRAAPAKHSSCQPHPTACDPRERGCGTVRGLLEFLRLPTSSPSSCRCDSAPNTGDDPHRDIRRSPRGGWRRTRSSRCPHQSPTQCLVGVPRRLSAFCPVEPAYSDGESKRGPNAHATSDRHTQSPAARTHACSVRPRRPHRRRSVSDVRCGGRGGRARALPPPSLVFHAPALLRRRALAGHLLLQGSRRPCSWPHSSWHPSEERPCPVASTLSVPGARARVLTTGKAVPQKGAEEDEHSRRDKEDGQQARAAESGTEDRAIALPSAGLAVSRTKHHNQPAVRSALGAD